MSNDTLNSPPELYLKGRAWVEIDLLALEHNAQTLQSLLPQGCQLMAVVKADAYGHGAIHIAKHLEAMGIKAFAVATVSEGVSLRQSGLLSDILIMNYTHPQNAVFLEKYGLMQLIVDGEYAKALNDSGYEIFVHISLDTGMHREGIDISKTEEIESIFSMKNLKVEGISTHFSSSDSLVQEDIDITMRQLSLFYDTVDSLVSKGYDVGKLHSQATYGLLNYDDDRSHFARIGIALYGVMSHDDKTRLSPKLKPVLSLRANIAQVRWIEAGESVSYGRTFVADKRIKLATVCVGYADGIPRNMSGKDATCLVHGKRAPILGRICMDLLMIDVSDIDNVVAGDVATLIGNDGDDEIRCEDFALLSDTITNEILSRLGSRLPRIYI
ncbi:MAG: serine racemase VanT catalytic subunit [Oscillospiraceae bacterium]|nr:serine racemase VanT catalytic subunit [Oscillospiraceae bacterium]